MAVLESKRDVFAFRQNRHHLPYDDDFITPDDFIELKQSDDMFYGIVTLTTIILVALILA